MASNKRDLFLIPWLAKDSSTTFRLHNKLGLYTVVESQVPKPSLYLSQIVQMSEFRKSAFPKLEEHFLFPPAAQLTTFPAAKELTTDLES